MAQQSTEENKTEEIKKPSIPTNFDDETFDNDDPLAGKVIERDYAKTGSLSSDQVTNDDDLFDRVEDFTFDDFDPGVSGDGDESNDDVYSSETDDAPASDNTEETKLAKKAQAQLVKSQSKKIVNMYCFVVLWAVRKFCKVNERTIYAEEEKGTLSAQAIISGLPLIDHIRRANDHIEELDFDPDQREELREALEIYMISQNITTSPGVNLALAAIVPTVGLFAKGFETKSNMKSLIKSVQALHTESIERNQALQDSLKIASETAENLSSELQSVRSEHHGLSAQLAEKDKELEELRKLVVPNPAGGRKSSSPRSSGAKTSENTSRVNPAKKAS